MELNCTSPHKPQQPCPLPVPADPVCGVCDAVEPYCTALDTKWVIDPDDPLCIPQCMVMRCFSDGTETIEINGIEVTPEMAGKTLPLGAEQKPKCEGYNVRPFIVTGPIAAQPLSTYIADALANDATPPAYATYGAPAATDFVASFDMVQEDGADIAMVDGQETAGYSFAASSDEDVLNQAIEIEIPDGCEFTVNVCLKKCLTKAEVAAL